MKLLYIGDSPTATTGFATITTNVCRELTKRGWDIHILGINYRGDPHDQPWPIYNAGAFGDQIGRNRINELCHKLQPDAVLMNNDWWIVGPLCKVRPSIPFIAYMPVDGCNVDRTKMEWLSNITLAIWYTKFARDEAEKKGFTGRSEIIPHGVDRSFFKPMPQAEARDRMGFLSQGLKDAFIVGNVNRNTPRKRIDLTIAYFCEWVRRFNRQDAYLYLHMFNKDKEHNGIDFGKLANWCGLHGRIITPDDEGFDTFNGFPIQSMPAVYNALDVQVTTTQGEGWGLPTMEGMACGTRQIVPAWSALGEWPDDPSCVKVPCTNLSVNLEGVVGGIADKEQFIEALEAAYQRKIPAPDPSRLDQYNWDTIGTRFHTALRRAIATFVAPELQKESA